MASLTDNLSTNYRGKETPPIVKPGPSIWEGLAELGSTVIEAHEGAKQTRARQDAARRQAAEDAQKASDLGAKNFLAEGSAKIAADGPGPADAAVEETVTGISTPEGSQVFGGPGGTTSFDLPLSDLDPEAASAGATAAQKASRLKTATEQGRLNETSYQIKLHQLIAEAFARYPNSKAVVWEEFKKYSIDHPLFADYKRASNAVDKVSDQEVENELADARYYQENLNPLVDDPNTTFENQVYEGRRLRALHNSNERAAKQVERAQTNNKYDQGQQDRERTFATQAWVTNYETYFTPKIEESNQLFMKISLDPSLSDADKYAQLSNGLNAYRSGSLQVLDYARNQILITSKGNVDMKLLDESFARMKARVDEVLLPFDPKNPMNIIQRNATQMKMIQDATGLEIEKASPLLMELKRSFPNTETLQLMIETTMSDPKIKDMLAYELRNWRGLGDPDSKVHLMNAINMVKSRNSQLRDLSPREGANALKNLQGFLIKSLPQAARTKDAGLIEDSITGLGKVANVAVDLPIGTKYTTTATALNLLANNSSATVLLEGSKSSSNGSYANIVADGVRAASQKGIINLLATTTGDPYWNIIYDKNQMRFVTKATGQKKITRAVGDPMDTKLGIRQPQGSVSVPPPSVHTTAKLGTLNDALQFMMKTGQFEDEMPIAKWTAPEQANYYATGQAPVGKMKEEATGNLAVDISKISHFWENFKVDWSKVNAVSFRESAAAQGIGVGPDEPRSVTGVKGQTVTVPATATIRELHGDKPVYQAVVAAAQREGIPESLLIRLASVETGNTFGEFEGKNRAGATGPLQVVGRKPNGKIVNDDLAIEMFGKSVYDLTTEQKVAVGARLLKKLYEKHGNWNMAVQRYLGTGNDGNLNTSDYAYLIGAD